MQTPILILFIFPSFGDILQNSELVKMLLQGSDLDIKLFTLEKRKK